MVALFAGKYLHPWNYQFTAVVATAIGLNYAGGIGMRFNARMTITICLLLVTLTAVTAVARQEFYRYPEYRYTSALPGGGFGVTSDGMPGFDGAMQLNVPVAYTPHQGAVVGYSSASFNSTFRIAKEGPNINGTGIIGIGVGKPGRGLFLVEMPTSIDWEPAQSIQQQIVPERRKQPAVAVGLQDIFENRDEAIGKPHGTDSAYVVATRQIGEDDRAVFLTLGYGNRRFNDSFFGGVSWRARNRLTIMAEYDGFNPNAAVAYDLSDILGDNTMIYAGYVDAFSSRRAVIGMSYVYSDLKL